VSSGINICYRYLFKQSSERYDSVYAHPHLIRTAVSPDNNDGDIKGIPLRNTAKI
jgi:hypothetical protein